MQVHSATRGLEGLIAVAMMVYKMVQRKIFQVFEKLRMHQSLSLPPCHPQMNACPLRNCNGAAKTRSFCAGGAAAIFQSHQWLPVDSRHACPVKSCIFSFTLHLLHSCLDSQPLNIFHGFMPLDAFAGSLVQFKVLADLYWAARSSQSI